jgi:hypothetical protein
LGSPPIVGRGETGPASSLRLFESGTKGGPSRGPMRRWDPSVTEAFLSSGGRTYSVRSRMPILAIPDRYEILFLSRKPRNRGPLLFSRPSPYSLEQPREEVDRSLYPVLIEVVENLREQGHHCDGKRHDYEYHESGQSHQHP